MQEARNATSLYWSAEPVLVKEVMVTILYFFSGSRLDADNVPKPILDALVGLMYADDALVTDMVCRSRHVNGNLIIDIIAD